MKKDKDVLIVVANSSSARFFKVELGFNLVELEALVHPDSRKHSRDLVSDKPGRGFESSHSGARHAMDPKTTPHEQQIIDFARKVCQHLDAISSKGEVKKIYLAANPSFLGLIRQHISPQSAQLITAEVSKDIIHLKPAEILEYFTVTL